MFPTPALACFIQYLFVDVVFMLCLVYVMVMFILVHNIINFVRKIASYWYHMEWLGVHVHGVIMNNRLMINELGA